MKRILSVVLLVAMLATLLPSMPIKAKAANRWEVINTGNVTGQDIAARAEFYIGAGRYDGSNYKERTGFGTTLHFDCSGFVYRVLRDLDLGSFLLLLEMCSIDVPELVVCVDVVVLEMANLWLVRSNWN